ncbi:MAG: hypothetical protein MI923_27315 [Phycisphaerales bacterium]|nr:hypothetical protein [Phycisphaerales bacterium]
MELRDDDELQRKVGGLEALVSSNRDGIVEVKQSIKELQASSTDIQKLLISYGDNVNNAVHKLNGMEDSLRDVKRDLESKNNEIEQRLDAVERLQAKVTGGLVVLVCLLNAPWEWLIKLFKAGPQ